MSAEIIPFAFNDHLVRTTRRGDEPWFVGKDVCNVLEIRNHNDALARLDPDERAGVGIPDPSGMKHTVIISEPGVFRLIFTSRKPEAEAFKRWLAHEVLPALRRTGRYDPAHQGGLPDALADGPTAALNVKLGLVREARLLFGAARARRLWEQLHLPKVPYAETTMDEAARVCLRHVLMEDTEAGETLFRVVDAALAGDTRSAKALEPLGLRVDPERHGVVIANNASFLSRIFEGTEYAGGAHVRLLRRLPGAQPTHVQRFGDTSQRGTFLPARLIDVLFPLTGPA